MSTQTVNLKLQLVGNVAQQLKSMNQDIQRDTRKVNELNKVGVRTQQRLAQEVQNTARNYRQLNSTGVATTNAIASGYRQARSENQKLNNELKKTERLYQHLSQGGRAVGKGMQGVGKGIQGATAVGGAVMAGGYVLNSQIQPQRSYDERLSDLTITASGNKATSADMDRNKVKINELIKTAARRGGSREEALSSLEHFISSGNYDLRTAGEVLGVNARMAFASGADAESVAQLTGAVKSYGIRGTDELDKAMNAAYVGGKLGSFELRDQAKWLPAQLSSAGGVGYSGVEGIQRVVAMNQVAMRTAGSSDEAGNNVKNLLDKLASSDFSRAMENNIKVREGDPLTAKGKFDWQGYMLEQREQGVMAADAFAGIIEREMASDSQYQALKNKQIDPNDSQAVRQKDEAMMNLLENSVVAGILTDQQARSGAVSLIRYQDDYQKMVSEMDSGSTLERDATWKSQQEHATHQQKVNEQLNIQYQSYQSVNEALIAFNTQLTGFMQNHSELASAAHQAGTALATIGAITTVGSVLGGGTKADKAGALRTAGSRAGAAGAVIGAGYLGYEAGGWLSKNFIEGTSVGDAIGSAIAHSLAFLGNDTAEEAVNNATKYEQMIAEQQQTREQQAQSNQIQSEMSVKQSQMTAQTAQMLAIQSQMTSQQGSMVALLNTIASKDFSPQINVQSSPTTIVKQLDGESKRGRFSF